MQRSKHVNTTLTGHWGRSPGQARALGQLTARPCRRRRAQHADCRDLACRAERCGAAPHAMRTISLLPAGLLPRLLPLLPPALGVCAERLTGYVHQHPRPLPTSIFIRVPQRRDERLQCPQGIPIYRCLYFPVYVNQFGRRYVLREGVPAYLRQAENCTACRQCEERCPFHLRVVDGLKENLALARRLAGL